MNRVTTLWTILIVASVIAAILGILEGTDIIDVIPEGPSWPSGSDTSTICNEPETVQEYEAIMKTLKFRGHSYTQGACETTSDGHECEWVYGTHQVEIEGSGPNCAELIGYPGMIESEMYGRKIYQNVIGGQPRDYWFCGGKKLDFAFQIHEREVLDEYFQHFCEVRASAHT
jgi:hypothetical protein